MCYNINKDIKIMNTTINNRDILRNIKNIAKDRKTNMREISLKLERHENFLSTIISKKKGLLSTELLVEISSILECSIAELIVSRTEYDNKDT